MAQIQSQDEYDNIVTELADEFTAEISRGCVHNVATQMIANFDIIDGKPVVCETPDYEGGSVESIDARIYPYTVLVFTRATNITPLSSQRAYEKPQAPEIAVKALVSDLLRAANGTYGDKRDEQKAPVVEP